MNTTYQKNFLKPPMGLNENAAFCEHCGHKCIPSQGKDGKGCEFCHPFNWNDSVDMDVECKFCILPHNFKFAGKIDSGEVLVIESIGNHPAEMQYAYYLANSSFEMKPLENEDFVRLFKKRSHVEQAEVKMLKKSFRAHGIPFI